jgi:hypothetical protein
MADEEDSDIDIESGDEDAASENDDDHNKK